MLKDVSCVKNGDHLYILGGKIHNGAWTPLVYVYRVELNQLRDAKPSDQTNINIYWSKQELAEYKPSSHLSFTTASSEGTIIYYGEGDSRPDPMELRIIQLGNKKAENLAVGTQVLMRKASYYNIKFNSLIQTSVLMNDLNQNEIIFLGRNVIGDGGKHYFGESINIFDKENLTWRSLLTTSLTGKRTISAVYNGILYVFGPGVNITKTPDHHVIPHYEKDSSFVLVEHEINSGFWVTRITTGDVPSSGINYSYTQVDHMLYLVGDNDGDNGKIYALNLKTKIWTVFNEPNFTGYESGCLTYHDNALIHCFGQNNQNSVKTVDISKFSQDNRPDGSNYNAISSTGNNRLIAIIVGSIGGFIALVAIVAAIIFLRRRQTKLKPPKLLSNFVMSDSLPNPLENRDLLQSSTSSLKDDSDLFRINELEPEECFKNELSSNGVLDMKTMKDHIKPNDL